MQSTGRSVGGKGKLVYSSFDHRDDLGIKHHYGDVDKASFGAPREVFNKVVGPTNFSY